MANTLKPGESAYFNLPEGSKSIVHMPDGSTQPATQMWISYMLDDIMILLNELKNKKSGVITINWLLDTFRCNWTIRWNDETLDIQAQWGNTVGNLEKLLNRCPNITLPKNDFIQEWKSVLGTVIKNLKDCGYNANNIKGMKQLIEIHNVC